MVLVTAMIFSKKFLKNHIEDFKKQFTLKNDKLNGIDEFREKGNLSVTAFLIMLFIVVMNVIPAIIIALHCFKKDTGILKYLHPIIAFLFSDIYMLIFVVRKFILKDNSFCVNIKLN